MNKEELQTKINNLDNVIRALEVTANTHYLVNDEGWNILLKAREKLKPFIDIEINNCYIELEKLE